MYFYKLKNETKTRFMSDEDVKGDPFTFFNYNLESLEHWCHINDNTKEIDIFYPEGLFNEYLGYSEND